jgi:hypothetical protein
MIIMYQAAYNRDLIWSVSGGVGGEHYNQLGNAAQFFNFVAFNEAHWLFAFNYWALSWRVDLIK